MTNENRLRLLLLLLSLPLSLYFSPSHTQAFRLFRSKFGIEAADIMVSLCDRPLRQLGNPGASGSLFFLTSDDKFIIKTVEGKSNGLYAYYHD